ncbi:MAG: hypothetical protein QOH71_2477 [Blastocatellia bacterium]|nr:hypothetical protein [Blastocatellia bacterium]
MTLIHEQASSGTYQDTAITYDGYGRLQTKHIPEQAAGLVTTWDYNPDDTILRSTDARGATSTFGYNNRKLVSACGSDMRFSQEAPTSMSDSARPLVRVRLNYSPSVNSAGRIHCSGRDRKPTKSAALLRSKPMPVLAGHEESLHHICANEVAIKLIQLIQPKVVTLIVKGRLWRVIRVAAQITKILH